MQTTNGGGSSRWTLKILACFRPEEDLIEGLREKKSEISKNRSTLRDCIYPKRRFSEREMDARRIGVIGG